MPNPQVPERKFSFISSEPRLAKILHERTPIIVPDELYHWLVYWVQDVGVVLRSRENRVGLIASAVTRLFTLSMAKAIPETANFGIISEALGFMR